MRSISSRNGHSIIFYDNDKGTDAIQSLSPLWSTINSFVPVLRWEGTEDMQKATGGIEFTDEYGLYSISMSSNKRTISIDSPLGSVSINAFTGITISAPNGNVRIEGKNIDIVAGNNLSISSGNNIIKEYWPLKAKNNILVGTKRISEVGEDLKAYNQEREDEGLSPLKTPPAGGDGGSGKKNEPFSDKEIEELASNF